VNVGAMTASRPRTVPVPTIDDLDPLAASTSRTPMIGITGVSECEAEVKNKA
jgi:hypothetical protein